MTPFWGPNPFQNGRCFARHLDQGVLAYSTLSTTHNVGPHEEETEVQMSTFGASSVQKQ